MFLGVLYLSCSLRSRVFLEPLGGEGEGVHATTAADTELDTTEKEKQLSSVNLA